MGQLINSVNNIYSICQTQKKLRSKRQKPPEGLADLTEKSSNLMMGLAVRLEFAQEMAEELMAVAKIDQVTGVRGGVGEG
jgi:hypothetical protein